MRVEGGRARGVAMNTAEEGLIAQRKTKAPDYV